MIGGALLDHRVGNAAETEEDQIVPIGFRFRFAGPVVAINSRRDNVSKRRVGGSVGVAVLAGCAVRFWRPDHCLTLASKRSP